ncbi:MAG: hypothetical protein QW836_09760 [Ignisphaera sp.]
MIETLINTLCVVVRGNGLDEGFESRCDALDEGSPRDTARCGVPGVALNTSKGDADPRPMQGKQG